MTTGNRVVRLVINSILDTIWITALAVIGMSANDALAEDAVSSASSISVEWGALASGVQQGQSYEFQITANAGGAAMYVGVWADWNRDEIFNEQSEHVWQGVVEDCEAHAIHLAIPRDAAVGSTRLCVIKTSDEWTLAADASEEVQELTVDVQPGKKLPASLVKEQAIRTAGSLPLADKAGKIPPVSASLESSFSQGVGEKGAGDDLSASANTETVPSIQPVQKLEQDSVAAALALAPVPSASIKASVSVDQVKVAVPASNSKTARASVQPSHGTIEMFITDVDAGTVRIMAAEGSPDSEWRVLCQTNASGSFWFTDTNAIAHLHSRFYRIVQELGGVTLTNSTLFGAFGRTMTPHSLHRMAVPIYAEGQDRLDTSLGAQIAQGLVGGDVTSGDLLYALGASGIWKTYRLNASGQWVNDSDGTIARQRISSSQGFWIQRRGGLTSESVVYAGPAVTNADSIVFSPSAWQVIAWPLAVPKWEDEGSNKGWGFAAAGAKRGTCWGNADQLIIEDADGTEYLWLNMDGRWCRWTETKPVSDIQLQAGIGYYYYHRGQGFTWTPEIN